MVGTGLLADREIVEIDNQVMPSGLISGGWRAAPPRRDWSCRLAARQGASPEALAAHGRSQRRDRPRQWDQRKHRFFKARAGSGGGARTRPYLNGPAAQAQVPPWRAVARTATETGFRPRQGPARRRSPSVQATAISVHMATRATGAMPISSATAVTACSARACTAMTLRLTGLPVVC